MVGDYHINLGQGLVHWQSMAFRKSSETMQVLRQGYGLRPYNGTDENKFHRGAGIELRKNHWNIILFFANDKLDGNILPDSSNPFQQVFTSYQTSGLHRTKTEREDKDALIQKAWGGKLGFGQGRFKIRC